jgi:hypothetical protein
MIGKLTDRDENQEPVECQHEEGTRLRQFDADGCGYYLWVCSACGWTTLDDMP